MLEGIVLLAFIAALAGCVFTGASVLWALAGGYLIFCAYGLIRKHSLAELGKMSLSGVNRPQYPDDFRTYWLYHSAVAGIRHDRRDRVLVVEAGVAVGISGDRVPS